MWGSLIAFVLLFWPYTCAGKSISSGPPQFCISYVNGIYHSKNDWERISEQLRVMFQGEVRPFYNPSSGWWLTDATKAGYHFVVKDLRAAESLANHLRSILEENAPNGRVLHIAHSAGSILTYLAAKHFLNFQEKNRIDVACFGGGKSITRKYFNGRVRNYYCRNDPCIFFDAKASSLAKQSGNASFAELKGAVVMRYALFISFKNDFC
jgi:hypothetical protein